MVAIYCSNCRIQSHIHFLGFFPGLHAPRKQLIQKGHHNSASWRTLSESAAMSCGVVAFNIDSAFNQYLHRPQYCLNSHATVRVNAPRKYSSILGNLNNMLATVFKFPRTRLMIIFFKFILSSKLNRVSTLPLDETMTVLS
jgi:hypothetical protein